MTAHTKRANETPIHVDIKRRWGVWRTVVRRYGNTHAVRHFATWAEACDFAQDLARREAGVA